MYSLWKYDWVFANYLWEIDFLIILFFYFWLYQLKPLYPILFIWIDVLQLLRQGMKANLAGLGVHIWLL